MGKIIPTTAYNLYKRLYIRRLRKENKATVYSNALVEATKSWLTLTDDEKKKFVNNLQLHRRRYNNEFASYLKDMEPYLKKKQNKRKQEEEQPPQPECNESANESVNNVDLPINFEEDLTLEHIGQHQTNIDNNTVIGDPVPEPIPPSVMHGRELYDSVKGENSKTWSDLLQSERRRYLTAVLKIKKEYIKNYKLYLESLSPKELYDHYHKTI